MFWAGRKGLPVSAKKFHFKFRFSFQSQLGLAGNPCQGAIVLPVLPEVESGVVRKRRYPEPRGIRCAKPPQSTKTVVLRPLSLSSAHFWRLT